MEKKENIKEISHSCKTEAYLKMRNRISSSLCHPWIGTIRSLTCQLMILIQGSQVVSNPLQQRNNLIRRKHDNNVHLISFQEEDTRAYGKIFDISRP